MDWTRLGALFGAFCLAAACTDQRTGAAVATSTREPATESTQPSLQAEVQTEATFGLQHFRFDSRPDTIWATGSWVAESGPLADNPIQTSDLWCFRDRRECTEARAFLLSSTNRLAVTTLTYQVRRWTDTEVTAEIDPDPLHTNTIEIRFDILKRSVQMTESKVPPGVTRSRYDAHLDDGDKVDRRPRK